MQICLSRDYGLNNNLLGIDVGEGTSDILLLAKDITADNVPRLYKQSSVRIAAGVFFEAVIKSAIFRKAIYNYHQGQKRIKVENIQEILFEGHKAPFYLNSVFDQLTDDDFSAFYSFIGREACLFMLFLPMSQDLIFYAGKLCSKTIKENNLTVVREVHLMPFGKGGRLFTGCKLYSEVPALMHIMKNVSVRVMVKGQKQLDWFIVMIFLLTINQKFPGIIVDTELIYDRNVRFSSDIFAEKTSNTCVMVSLLNL